MSKLSTLVFGIFVVFAAAWFGIVGYSYLYLGRMEAAADENTGGSSPPPLSGLATAGQRVYAANGCVSCHTQQVRARPWPATICARIRRSWETCGLDPT